MGAGWDMTALNTGFSSEWQTWLGIELVGDQDTALGFFMLMAEL